MDLDQLWTAQSGAKDQASPVFVFAQEHPGFIDQAADVFKHKMKALLVQLKSSIIPTHSSDNQLGLYRDLRAALKTALDRNLEQPSCVRTVFGLKHAQDSLALLSDLLNKQVFRVEAVYTDYARELARIFKTTAEQVRLVTPKSVLEPHSSPLHNNFLKSTPAAQGHTTHAVNSLSNGNSLLPGDTLQLFREGNLASVRSVLEFVLEPLRQSLSRHCAEFALLEPLERDSLHAQPVPGAHAWEALARPAQRREFLEKEYWAIPLLGGARSGVGSVAFVCRKKARESIAIYSPSTHESRQLKQSAFYYLRWVGECE